MPAKLKLLLKPAKPEQLLLQQTWLVVVPI